MQRNLNRLQKYFNRGVVHTSKGNYDEAISDFNKAIELEPDNAELYQKIGYARYRQVFFNTKKWLYGNWRSTDLNKLTQAIAELTRAIELNPNNAFAYQYRAEAYKLRGDYANAAFDYAKAIELNPAQEKNIRITCYNMLYEIPKKILFENIKTLPKEKQIVLLNQCMDSNTEIGKRFWRKEGLKSCNMQRGTLNEIRQYAKFINPQESSTSIHHKKLDNSLSASILRTISTLFPSRSVVQSGFKGETIASRYNKL